MSYVENTAGFTRGTQQRVTAEKHFGNMLLEILRKERKEWSLRDRHGFIFSVRVRKSSGRTINNLENSQLI
jgi:hypothetical protein